MVISLFYHKVIGNSRAIWPIFIEYLSSIDYHMNDDPNPLDEYELVYFINVDILENV